jgi:hypothetical protein
MVVPMLPRMISENAKLSSMCGTKVALRIVSQGSLTIKAVNRYRKAIADRTFRYRA